MTLDLEAVTKAILGAEENGPAFGDLLEPGQAVTFRVAGVPGEKGDKGDRGDRGERGFPGDDGLEGPIGPVGPKGDTGDPGKDGSDGKTGSRGMRGPQGETGDRGPKGFDGKDGQDGPPGPRGLRGPAGLGGGGGGGSGGAGGSDDQTAAEVPFTPAGGIAATDVQAAIEEVAAGGGGTQTAREWIQGSDGALTTGTQLPWAHFAGDALLDYTDPLIPTIIDAGLYCVMAAVAGPTGITDITKQMFVGLDVIGGDVFIDGATSLVPAYGGGAAPLMSHSLTVYFEAGDTLELIIRHNLDAPGAFGHNAWVQRIS